MQEFIRRHTIDEALEIATRPTWYGAASRREKKRGDWDEDGKWAGGSWEDAVKHAKLGNPSNTVHLDEFKNVLVSVRSTMRPAPRWDVAGSTVDVGRHMSGEPESMIDVIRSKRQSPMIRIAVERAVNAGVSPEDIRATGASVLAAVQAMRTAGIPAEIWATFTVGSSRVYGQMLSYQILVQESGRPVNLNLLAFWITSPAAFRRIVFAMEEQEPKEIREAFRFEIGGGYGRAANVKQMPSQVDHFDEIAPAYARQAEEWLVEVMSRRSGITFKGKGDNEGQRRPRKRF